MTISLSPGVWRRLAMSAGLIIGSVTTHAPAVAQKALPTLDRRTDVIRYTARKGDNLYTLADRYFVRLQDYRIVQRMNRIADPYRIPVGSVIVMPVSLLRAEQLSARLIAARGGVRVLQDEREIPVVMGMTLPVGAALETGANGFLTIELPNGSRTTLPTHSRIVVRQLRRILITGGIDYDLDVAAGKAETQATPIEPGKGEFRVRTSRAVSAVRGTRFRVGFASEQTSAEVLDGVVAVGTVKDGGNAAGQPIEHGFGAFVAPGGGVTKQALLPPVELAEPGKLQIDPLVELALVPVPSAASYHVQIGADAGFVDIVADQMVTEPAAAFPDIANGNWFVRATAISPAGLEGLYQAYAMKRRLTGLKATAEGDLSLMRFRWSGAGEGVRAYRFQMTRDTPDALPVIDEAGLGPQGLELRNLDPGIYHWRVGVRQFADGEMTEKWLAFEKLIIAPGQ